MSLFTRELQLVVCLASGITFAACVEQPSAPYSDDDASAVASAWLNRASVGPRAHLSPGVASAGEVAEVPEWVVERFEAIGLYPTAVDDADRLVTVRLGDLPDREAHRGSGDSGTPRLLPLSDPPREGVFTDTAPEEPSFEHPAQGFASSLYWGGGSFIDRWWMAQYVDMWSTTWTSEALDYVDVIAYASVDNGFFGYAWDVRYDATEASVWFQFDPAMWWGGPGEFFQQFGDHMVADSAYATLDHTGPWYSCHGDYLCHNFFSYALRWEP